MKTLMALFVLLSLTASQIVAQDILIYHGQNSETSVYDHQKNPVLNLTLKKKQGDHFRVRIVNPNPLFYKYEIKYEQQAVQSEEESITSLLMAFNQQLNDRYTAAAKGIVAGTDADYDNYKAAIESITQDITKAKSIVEASDIPELPLDALSYARTGGLRYAIEQVTNPARSVSLSTSATKFHSPTLAADLDALLEKVSSIDNDPLAKEALTLLNQSLVKKVEELKASMAGSRIATVINSDFVVTDKITKVFLLITPIDANNKNLVRDTYTESNKIEVATIVPLYDRKTLELIPVGNFLFANNVLEYYLENKLVQSRQVNKVSFSPGVVLNINAARFGEAKEMSVGFGAGYKFSNDSKLLQNFYLSTLFSYKDFFRIGIGVGFSQYPSHLNSGAAVNQALPDNIANLEDMIEYKDKLTGFLSIAFTGLSLSKK